MSTHTAQAYSDSVTLTQRLIRRESITPSDEGCQDLVYSYLKDLHCTTEPFYKDGTVNLLVTHGSGYPFILFLGHTDVVPSGDPALWTHPPFGAKIITEGDSAFLYGRGAADMKASDAAMTIAMRDFIKAHPHHKGTVGILLTSNEEGDGKGGVAYVASKLEKMNLIPDFCLVGEPSCNQVFGDTIKVGRRGSLTAHITVTGKQGHVAYPDRVINPIHLTAQLIERLQQPLDQGNEVFPPTSFEVTNIHAGTGAENVVPATCSFMCNWRFNNLQSKESIELAVNKAILALNLKCEVRYVLNGQPFVSAESEFCHIVQQAVEKHTGVTPVLSTSGGTSDGRFIAPLGSDVLEFGPRSLSIHQIDEKVAISEIDTLTDIYREVLQSLLLSGSLSKDKKAV